MTPELLSLESATALVRHRRTIKPEGMDSGRAVGRGLVVALLENATWAPTHGMTEPWRFVVFTGGGRAALARRLQEVYRETTPPGEFRGDKFAKLGGNPLLAPVVVALCVTAGSNPKIPEVEEVAAVACAVQNFHLSAAAAGLGGFWSSPPAATGEEIKPFFGLGERDRCLGLFYLGYPKEGARWPTSVRRPVEEKIDWRES